MIKLNDQEYITTNLLKNLEKMVPLSLNRLRNLASLIFGIIIGESVLISNIAQELKDTYSKGTEASKNKRIYRFLIGESVLISNIAQELKDTYSKGTEASKNKRIYRFLINDKFDAEEIYRCFIYNALKVYKNFSNKVDIIIDHTTIEDKFVILQIVMRIGKRSVPLWYKVFRYKEEGNKSFTYVKEGLNFVYSILKPYNFEVTLLADRGFNPLWYKVFRYKEEGNKSFTYVKEGLNFVYSILKPYNFEVTLLADRGFKSLDLFKFIEEDLQWNYCIRCTKDMLLEIENNPKIKTLSDIKTSKSRAKYFYNVKLSAKKHVCNIAVHKDSDNDDPWYIINNIGGPKAILRYKRRFEIEGTFKDFKSGGFNLEETWSNNITFIKNLYLCISIAYYFVISIGTICMKKTFKDFKSGGFNLEETWSNNITFIKNLYLCISIAYYFVISIGTICMKNKKNKIISATKKLKGKEKRVYSLFRAGLKWIKRSYYQCRKKYYLKFSFVIYEL